MFSIRGIAKKSYARFYNYFRRRMGFSVDRAHIFDAIYHTQKWGSKGGVKFYSGEGSHDADLVDDYIKLVRSVKNEFHLSMACDLGAGDFNVGKKLVDFFDSYTACDVVADLIEQNKTNYGGLATFCELDICSDELPVAEIYFVRQVLQHLDNESIRLFIKNVSQQRGALLMITEEVSCHVNAQKNLDLVAGSGTRINSGSFGSGVDVQETPFSVEWELLKQIELWKGESSKIITNIYRL
jgi:hypothetical protein